MNQMQAFIEKAKSDSSLLAKLNELDAEGIVALAAEHGYNITVEDYREAYESAGAMKIGELAEEDLDVVSGGGGATQNRWNPEVCNNYNRTHYNCVGFLGLTWCDHYERTEQRLGGHRHVCKMGSFDYIADAYGDVK